MEISVIIVSYNTSDLIGNCLRSVMAKDIVGQEVFVVDNASSDGSADIVRENFPSCRLITNSENRGFAAANNQALTYCRGRYILFLNPDTEVRPGAFQKALSFMEAVPHCGLAGLKTVNPDGTLQESISYRYPGQKHAGGELKNLRGAIACVLGAAMIARTDIIREIGGFDEDFFLYGEDQDLCLRIRKAGYEIAYIPSAVVAHLGGQSERCCPRAEVWKKKTQAELLFYRKHYLPETIRRNVWGHLVKACWRIAALKMQLPFAWEKDKIREKLIKYQAIYEVIRSFGKQNKGKD